MISKAETYFTAQKQAFATNKTKSYEWRLEQLDRLQRLLTENHAGIDAALAADFKTARWERDVEFYGVLGGIAETREKLAGWMNPEEVALPPRFAQAGHRGIIYREPYGVCLVIAPFNAPIALAFHPIMTALSAGNTVIVKPSEVITHTSALYAELFGKYFDADAVAVVEGGRETVEELLKKPFDFLFFTGSTKVGQVVMRAAAENLTPVLLELGGQNPAIVDATADIRTAAEKLVWGAMAFGGQWCVSPGYVYVHASVAEAFVAAARQAVATFYGPDPRNSTEFSRIVTARDVERLRGMLEGASVVAGGECDPEAQYVAPTLVYPASWSDRVMDGEIFGPILPILTYVEIDTVISTINSRPKSLSAYVFSKDQALIDKVMLEVSFGAGAVNETMIQCMMSSSLPFGGIGNSGIGQYFGKYGFDSLSHLKSVVVTPGDSSFDLLLPPHTEERTRALWDWFSP